MEDNSSRKLVYVVVLVGAMVAALSVGFVQPQGATGNIKWRNPRAVRAQPRSTHNASNARVDFSDWKKPLVVTEDRKALSSSKK